MRLTGAQNIDNESTRSGGPASRSDTEADAPLRVLLVEDSPLIRERLAESIADPGRIEIVGQADSEQAAIGMLAAAPWDAMVLDLQLRHGTGLGVLRALCVPPSPADRSRGSPSVRRRRGPTDPAARRRLPGRATCRVRGSRRAGVDDRGATARRRAAHRAPRRRAMAEDVWAWR